MLDAAFFVSLFDPHSSLNVVLPSILRRFTVTLEQVGQGALPLKRPRPGKETGAEQCELLTFTPLRKEVALSEVADVPLVMC